MGYRAKGVKIGGLNVCSLSLKIDDVMAILNSSDLDYLGISESWLNSAISTCEIKIDGYHVLRNDRGGGASTVGGGGIVVYSHDHYV